MPPDARSSAGVWNATKYRRVPSSGAQTGLRVMQAPSNARIERVKLMRQWSGEPRSVDRLEPMCTAAQGGVRRFERGLQRPQRGDRDGGMLQRDRGVAAPHHRAAGASEVDTAASHLDERVPVLRDDRNETGRLRQRTLDEVVGAGERFAGLVERDRGRVGVAPS
jgi:hypothetical protein